MGPDGDMVTVGVGTGKKQILNYQVICVDTLNNKQMLVCDLKTTS